MNGNEIRSNPQINGMRKRLVKEQTHTEVDAQGNIKRIVVDQNAFADSEPDYIKIYTDCQLVINHLDVALSPYVVCFGKYMTWANEQHENFRCIIQTTKLVRQAVADQLGVTDRQVQRAIKTLVDSEIFIPIYNEEVNKSTGEVRQVRMRGAYFVNPWVLSKGEWKDIKQLRQSFEFVSGASSICAIDTDGNRHVMMPLTTRADGQLEMDLDALQDVEEQ